MKATTLAMALALGGCPADALSLEQTSNAQVVVGRLFDHEGCTVYRFRDGGRDHYYVRCVDGSASTTTGHVERSGKMNVYVPEEIRTEHVR